MWETEESIFASGWRGRDNITQPNKMNTILKESNYKFDLRITEKCVYVSAYIIGVVFKKLMRLMPIHHPVICKYSTSALKFNFLFISKFRKMGVAQRNSFILWLARSILKTGNPLELSRMEI
jgi:hypothetical protein